MQELNQRGLMQLDLTEVPGLDNLHNPCACLRESQNLAASVFKAQETFYLVNGSTVGLEAAILAINSPQGKAIIPRHAHVSVLNALILSGGNPIVAPVLMEKTWGIPLGVSPETLSALIEKEITLSEEERLLGKVLGKEGEAAGKKALDFVLTVNPTYQGVGYTAGAIKKLVQEKGIPHVVDEAHGAHLFFQEGCPLSLQKEQADIVVQSTHKTLAAFTQASMLHVNTPHYRAPIREALQILQTTSPSYLLLASLDSVQAQMQERGAELVEKKRELADLLRKEMRGILGLKVFPEGGLPRGWHYDPAKVLVSAADLGLTGWELAELLRVKQGIIVEMADYFSVLFLVTWGHDYEDIGKVGRALREIVRTKKGKGKPLPALNYPADLYERTIRLLLTPREVYYNKKEAVSIEAASGRISGKALTVYPPGIPCVWPGQVLEPAQIEYLQWALDHKLAVQGVSEDNQIAVIKES